MTDTPKHENGEPQKVLDIAKVRPAMPARGFSLIPQSLGEAKEIASLIAGSDFAPKDYRGKPENVMIAIQMGIDLGLKPMQALQNIAVINGRPSIYGDAALALVMPALERFLESFDGQDGSDAYMAVCIAKRRGWPDETRRTFSIADAKKANLWGKAGPWTTYPKRMLQWRARGFALRDIGSDLLLGLVLVEEAHDIPIEGQQLVAVEMGNDSPAVLTFRQLPEGIQESIEKAFAVMNFSAGQRLTKLNEYFGGDFGEKNGEDMATALLDWLKDEYAKRLTGQPRKRGRPPGSKAVVVPADPAPSQKPSQPAAIVAPPAAVPAGVDPPPQAVAQIIVTEVLF